jgi:hypothetical protein
VPHSSAWSSALVGVAVHKFEQERRKLVAEDGTEDLTPIRLRQLVGGLQMPLQAHCPTSRLSTLLTARGRLTRLPGPPAGTTGRLCNPAHG